VLSTPPAFVLSQDQTLRKELACHPPAEAGDFTVLWKAVNSVLLCGSEYTVDPPGLDGVILDRHPEGHRVEPGRDSKRYGSLSGRTRC
jgi:hypothetical protein